jgi:hypothetical protein
LEEKKKEIEKKNGREVGKRRNQSDLLEGREERRVGTKKSKERESAIGRG